MKPKTSKIALALIALASLTPALAAGPNGPPPSAPRLHLDPLYATAVAPLTTEEAAVLLWMREEEKLSRDTYQLFFSLWNEPIFRLIATSEQRHFDAVGAKLTLFGLADPALPAAGQFTDAQLQAAYDELTASGSISYAAALTAAAGIEDMDIRDLQAALDATDHPVLERLYGNLLEASKFHLRAFVSRLQLLGIEYQPQYMDPILYEAIVGN